MCVWCAFELCVNGVCVVCVGGDYALCECVL